MTPASPVVVFGTDTPFGRFGDPITDIGPAAAFLCSHEARYVTGQTLIVSGGRYTAL